MVLYSHWDQDFEMAVKRGTIKEVRNMGEVLLPRIHTYTHIHCLISISAKNVETKNSMHSLAFLSTLPFLIGFPIKDNVKLGQPSAIEAYIHSFHPVYWVITLPSGAWRNYQQ